MVGCLRLRINRHIAHSRSEIGGYENEIAAKGRLGPTVLVESGTRRMGNSGMGKGPCIDESGCGAGIERRRDAPIRRIVRFAIEVAGEDGRSRPGPCMERLAGIVLSTRSLSLAAGLP